MKDFRSSDDRQYIDWENQIRDKMQCNNWENQISANNNWLRFSTKQWPQSHTDFLTLTIAQQSGQCFVNGILKIQVDLVIETHQTNSSRKHTNTALPTDREQKATRRVSSFIPKSPRGTYVGRDVTCIMCMRSIPKSPHGTYTYVYTHARAVCMQKRVCMSSICWVSISTK